MAHQFGPNFNRYSWYIYLPSNSNPSSSLHPRSVSLGGHRHKGQDRDPREPRPRASRGAPRGVILCDREHPASREATTSICTASVWPSSSTPTPMSRDRKHSEARRAALSFATASTPRAARPRSQPRTANPHDPTPPVTSSSSRRLVTSSPVMNSGILSSTGYPLGKKYPRGCGYGTKSLPVCGCGRGCGCGWLAVAIPGSIKHANILGLEIKMLEKTQ
jgi:hypothetical protein